jgi:hypothetical protein
MTRDELTFATVAQLAGLVRDDWDEAPEDVKDWCKILSKIDYADTQASLTYANNGFTFILAKGAEWQSPVAAMVKKELVSRVKEYEEKFQTTPIPVSILVI